MASIDLYNGDCLEILKDIPDKSVDLVVIDPPYEFYKGEGGGAFGSKRRKYHQEYLDLYHETQNESDKIRNRDEIRGLSYGFNISILNDLDRIMKNTNIYIWCSKSQVSKILNYYEGKENSIDILTWHKTNPTPTCNNTYLSDTEYCIFARGKGVKVGVLPYKEKILCFPC